MSSWTFGRFSPEPMNILEKLGVVERNPFARPLTEEELADLAKDSEAIIVGMDPVTDRVLEALDKLRVIGRYGVGCENIDVESATKRGVVVTYAPDANARAVAEYVFALVLSLVRSIIRAGSCIRMGEWGGSDFPGVELGGKTIGIIGLGAIGSRVARIARGFDMKLVYHDVVRRHNLERELGIRRCKNLHDLLRSCDFITIHVPLTPKTRHMIGADELKSMKRTSFLINTSRGGIIDERCLIQALKEKTIAGAALDVFEEEPVNAINPLVHMQNVVATPHIAWFTREAVKRVDAIVASDVAAVLKGGKPTHTVNPGVFLF